MNIFKVKATQKSRRTCTRIQRPSIMQSRGRKRKLQLTWGIKALRINWPTHTGFYEIKKALKKRLFSILKTVVFSVVRNKAGISFMYWWERSFNLCWQFTLKTYKKIIRKFCEYVDFSWNRYILYNIYYISEMWKDDGKCLKM